MERRVINSIDLEDGKRVVYMEKLNLEIQRREYYVGSIVCYVDENLDEGIRYPATFFTLDDRKKVERILEGSRRIQCNNLLQPLTVGVKQIDGWILAFHQIIDHSFVEWADRQMWITDFIAEHIARSLFQLMECVHGYGFRIGRSLESPWCYGMISDSIFLIDLEGSICPLSEGDKKEDEKKEDVRYLGRFLQEKIVPMIENQHCLSLRDFVELTYLPSIDFSHLKNHPFGLETNKVSWFYYSMSKWYETSTALRLSFEKNVKKRSRGMRWRHFPDWTRIVGNYALLNAIYQHKPERYQGGGAGKLLLLARNGLAHFRDYEAKWEQRDPQRISTEVNAIYPNFMAVCYSERLKEILKS